MLLHRGEEGVLSPGDFWCFAGALATMQGNTWALWGWLGTWAA
jgi:hypothetical protein